MSLPGELRLLNNRHLTARLSSSCSSATCGSRTRELRKILAFLHVTDIEEERLQCAFHRSQNTWVLQSLSRSCFCLRLISTVDEAFPYPHPYIPFFHRPNTPYSHPCRPYTLAFPSLLHDHHRDKNRKYMVLFYGLVIAYMMDVQAALRVL